MKHIKVNLDIITAMSPCKDRLDNYRTNYGALTFSLVDFLALDKITALDKQWVIKRLYGISQDFWIIYALDCALSANSNAAYATAADAAAAADAADAATAAAYGAADAAAAAYAAAAAAAYGAADAADAADAAAYAAAYGAAAADAADAADDAAAAYAAAYAAEYENQIDVLIYLLNNWD